MKTRLLYTLHMIIMAAILLLNCGSNGTTEPEEISSPEFVTGPTVSSISTFSAEVRWQTDVVANSIVRYGTTAGNYSDIEQSTVKEKNHFIPLSGLSANTTYYFIAESENAGGTTNSPEGQFTTKMTVDMMFAQAWDAYESGQYRQAIDHFKDILATSSSFTEAYLGLGWAYAATEIDSLQKAKFNFTTALSFQDDLAAAYAGRGFVNMALEISHQAVNDFLNVLQLDDHFVFEHNSNIDIFDVRLGLAESYYYQQKYDLAQSQVDELDTDNGLDENDASTWNIGDTVYQSYAEALLALIERLRTEG